MKLLLIALYKKDKMKFDPLMPNVGGLLKILYKNKPSLDYLITSQTIRKC